MVYLFIGDDEVAKKEKVEAVKAKFLNPKNRDFNYNLLFANDLNLKSLQEILRSFPVNAQKRIVIIKEALNLNNKIKDFLLTYAKNFPPGIILILDIPHFDNKDNFLKKMLQISKVLRFGESSSVDTFKLCDALDKRNIVLALKILHNLLKSGEKPERILGGLRYRWEHGYLSAQEKIKRLNLLLNSDIEIKKGRLKPEYSLEKLCINLCCF